MSELSILESINPAEIDNSLTTVLENQSLSLSEMTLIKLENFSAPAFDALNQQTELKLDLQLYY